MDIKKTIIIIALLALVLILAIGLIIYTPGISDKEEHLEDKDRIEEKEEKEDIDEEDENDRPDKVGKREVELREEGEIIEVLDEQEELVFEYSIDEFVEWAKLNWDDLFEEPPAFGEMREVNPDRFHRFDEGVSLSPCFEYLAFSVNDYAAASTISFVGLVDLKEKEVDLIRDSANGGIQNLFWSPQSSHLAYILDTARAQGDHISVDELEDMTKAFTLSGRDISQELGLEVEHIMPNFSDLDWIEEGQRLEFDTYIHSEDRSFRWSIKKDGTDLKRED